MITCHNRVRREAWEIMIFIDKHDNWVNGGATRLKGGTTIDITKKCRPVEGPVAWGCARG